MRKLEHLAARIVEGTHGAEDLPTNAVIHPNPKNLDEAKVLATFVCKMTLHYVDREAEGEYWGTLDRQTQANIIAYQKWFVAKYNFPDAPIDLSAHPSPCMPYVRWEDNAKAWASSFPDKPPPKRDLKAYPKPSIV